MNDGEKSQRMGDNTRKMLIGFINSLPSQAESPKTPTTPFPEEEVESFAPDKIATDNRTERRIKALWNNLKNQLMSKPEKQGETNLPKEEDASSHTQVSTPPPTRQSHLEPEEVEDKVVISSLREVSSPSLGRKLSESTKKRVRRILDGLKKPFVHGSKGNSDSKDRHS
jgi:hypothetical protein